MVIYNKTISLQTEKWQRWESTVGPELLRNWMDNFPELGELTSLGIYTESSVKRRYL